MDETLSDVKLERVEIKNFRSIKEMAFTFPKSGFLVLVGANNAGKSNIIRAIDAICGDQWFGSEKVNDHDHYLRDRTNPISIKLGFDNRCSARWSSESEVKWPAWYDANERRDWKAKPKEEFPCIYLGADRTFDKHLAFYDWTLIGKIRRAFHHNARDLNDELNKKFEEVVQVFERVPGFPQFKKDFTRFFNEMQADTSARLSIDFKPYTPSNYFKTMQIVAQDPQVGDRFDLEELGEGSRNMVLLALLRSYAENFRGAGDALQGVLALEEPELYLHPQARRHLFKVLRDIASSGMQVIISTHSASFLETEFFDSIGRVVKVEDDESPGRSCTTVNITSKRKLLARCERTGVPKGKATEENIGAFYKTTSNPMLNEAFFARFLILVEGDTEELAFPVFLAKAGIDCDLLGISVISVRGKTQVPKYWRLFTAFDIPTLAVVDNDAAAKDAGTGSNLGLVSCFGFDLNDLLAVNVAGRFDEDEKHLLVIEQDYEHALREDFGAFGRVEQLDEFDREARELIKPVGDQNKGQVARFIARRLCEDHPGFTPRFVTLIVELLRDHGIGTPVEAEPEAEPEELDEEIPF